VAASGGNGHGGSLRGAAFEWAHRDGGRAGNGVTRETGSPGAWQSRGKEPGRGLGTHLPCLDVGR
jgi:hypothetical protein